MTGNGHARRMLVESAWSYRFPARQTMHLKRKAKMASPEAKAIAWRAQKRLCGRYRQLSQAGKNIKLVCVAIARELVGFIWDIVRHEMPRLERPGRACGPLSRKAHNTELETGGTTGTLTQGLFGRCGEPLCGLHRHRPTG